ncbi:MAG: amidohydrolase [Acidobacteriia bacterium]|nr:amidohydrolase [Terriglobia bacterium]
MPLTPTQSRDCKERVADLFTQTRKGEGSCREPYSSTVLICLTLILLSSTLPAADLLLRNGHIWTGDPQHPWVEAVAITKNKISAVGTNAEVGTAAQTIDLRGRLVSPGFNDAHIHFLNGSLGLFQVDLFNAGSLEEMQKRVGAFAKSHPDEKWITGGGWEYGWFPDHRLPTKEDLDKIVPDRPVYLKAFDGHTGWVNSEALRRADVNGATKFDGFGEIVKDAHGRPTGALKENAQSVVTRIIPQPSRERKIAALIEGQKLAASLGITSIQNGMGSPDELSLYEQLLKDGKLTLRTNMAMTVTPSDDPKALETYAALNRSHPGPWLRAGAIKLVMDGVVESHTAAMLEPYADDPKTSGNPVWTQEKLDKIVQNATNLGLQIYTHAIGDRSVRMTLDAYERVHPQGKRLRIEHIETVSPADLPRFAKLGVIPSMQPIHADPESAEPWERAVGPMRMRLAFAWRDFEKSGALLTFSSDWPAAIDLNPIHAIYCAVTRQTAEGQPAGGWVPEQRIGVETALRAYTVMGAYSSFDENLKGQIKPGMLADMIVFSADLLRIAPAQIPATRVLLTILDGRIVFRDKSI